MSIRITQERIQALITNPDPNTLVTQVAVEVPNQPPGTQRARVTQIAIEFPFPGPSVPIPTPVPTPTRGDIVPVVCEPAFTQSCPDQPDLSALNEPCEFLGS